MQPRVSREEKGARVEINWRDGREKRRKGRERERKKRGFLKGGGEGVQLLFKQFEL